MIFIIICIRIYIQRIYKYTLHDHTRELTKNKNSFHYFILNIFFSRSFMYINSEDKKGVIIFLCYK